MKSKKEVAHIPTTEQVIALMEGLQSEATIKLPSWAQAQILAVVNVMLLQMTTKKVDIGIGLYSIGKTCYLIGSRAERRGWET